jgi:hypothetical protein
MLIKSLIKPGYQRLIVVILHYIEDLKKCYIWFITSMLQNIKVIMTCNRLFCYPTIKK